MILEQGIKEKLENKQGTTDTRILGTVASKRWNCKGTRDCKRNTEKGNINKEQNLGDGEKTK